MGKAGCGCQKCRGVGVIEPELEWLGEQEEESTNKCTGCDNPAGTLESESENELNPSSPGFVRWVQRSLNQVMGLRLIVDGRLGFRTRSAIRNFQIRRGLPADGVVGPRTEAALRSAGAAAPSINQPESEMEWLEGEEQEVSRGSREYIRWAQQSLNKVMGFALAVDGKIGSKTRGAISAFQLSRGLTPDGKLGSKTEAALIAAGAPKPPSGASGASTVSSSQINTPLPPVGLGYYTTPGRTPKQYGIPETIRAILTIAARWFAANTGGPRIGIGDISKKGGGPLSGHKSHQKGVDVDIRLVRSDGKEGPVTCTDSFYSPRLTQKLIDLIHANGVLRVQYIFCNDRRLKGVQCWPNHHNHLHVRFYPPAPQSELDLEWLEGEDEEQEVNRSSSAYVRWVQQSLNRIARAGLTEDGKMGPRTRAAIQAFQTSKGLKADGKVGTITERALRDAGAPPSPEGPGPAPAPRPKREPVRVLCPPPAELTEAEKIALAVTTRFETGIPYGCAVSAVDGISMGMLQWNLAPGTLQTVLSRFSEARLPDFSAPIRSVSSG